MARSGQVSFSTESTTPVSAPRQSLVAAITVWNRTLAYRSQRFSSFEFNLLWHLLLTQPFMLFSTFSTHLQKVFGSAERVRSHPTVWPMTASHQRESQGSKTLFYASQFDSDQKLWDSLPMTHTHTADEYDVTQYILITPVWKQDSHWPQV